MSKSIYPNYIFDNYIISPLDNTIKKGLTLNYLKRFGYNSFDEFRLDYPNFPRMCNNSKKKQNSNKANNASSLKSKLIRDVKIIIYNQNPKHCPQCNTILNFKNKHNKFCNNSCSASYNNIRKKKKKKTIIKKIKSKICKVDFITCTVTGKLYCSRGPNGGHRQISPYTRTEKQKYYNDAKFMFNVYHYPKYFNLSLIEKFGWYTCPGRKRKNLPKNTNGVSRDHMLSISEGFKNGYDPINLAHPANCQLLQHIDNKQKHGKSSITYDELLIRIKNWKMEPVSGTAPDS